MKGPFSFSELRDFALEKVILPETEVWQGGQEDRKRLARSVSGLLPKKTVMPKKLTAPHHIKKLSQEIAEATPQVMSSPPPKPRSIQDGPPGGLYLPGLHQARFGALVSLVLTGSGLVYGARNFIPKHAEDLSLTALGLGLFCLVGALVLALVYLGRAWNMLKGVGLHQSGLKMALPILIPVVGGLASFPAIYRWAMTWNRFQKSHPGLRPAQPVSGASAFLLCVGILVLQVSLVGWWSARYFHLGDSLAWQAASGCGAVLVACFGLLTGAQMCGAINFLARKK